MCLYVWLSLCAKCSFIYRYFFFKASFVIINAIQESEMMGKKREIKSGAQRFFIYTYFKMKQRFGEQKVHILSTTNANLCETIE